MGIIYFFCWKVGSYDSQKLTKCRMAAYMLVSLVGFAFSALNLLN